MNDSEACVIDVGALSTWMDDRGLGGGPLSDAVEIGGGTQNVMLRFTRGDREYVLRRGPRHLRPTSNDALRSEIRVLHALSDTQVPHPRLIAACTDLDVLGGAVFYLMQPVAGFNAAAELPRLHAASAAIRKNMGIELIDALATLGQVDHHAVGLGDLGRPQHFLERQVPRWLRELDSYSAFGEYPGPVFPRVTVVADWLERNRPTSFAPGLMHGDFHLANVMFSLSGPQVAAIVDWEMCTVGDPLLDLGWVLATWPAGGEADDIFDSPLAQAGGLPTTTQLVKRYAERSGRDLSAINWYAVLACFKLAIILEGTYARSCAGQAPRPVGERLHGLAMYLFERAHKLIAAA
jgi:aminoglycoside phosphotransferase (APT) family kinase protein